MTENDTTKIPTDLIEAAKQAHEELMDSEEFLIGASYDLESQIVAQLTAVLPLYKKKLLDEIDSCTQCGKVHEHRIIKTKEDGSPLQGSWADPDDGHFYARDVRGALRRLRDQE